MGKVMIEVDDDSLEAAIAGTRRGETWKADEGEMCVLGWSARAEWHRVEEPILCPLCGKEMETSEYAGDWWMLCKSGGHVVEGPVCSTESEARAAMRALLKRRTP